MDKRTLLYENLSGVITQETATFPKTENLQKPKIGTKNGTPVNPVIPVGPQLYRQSGTFVDAESETGAK